MAANNAPITIVTATPGGGKTALVVKMMKDAIDAKRPVFQMGIPELQLPYIPTPPLSEWTEMRVDPENPDHQLPYFTFPENALIVLDEAQRIYRPRPAASKLPDYVAAFETVRHTGVTFIMITQDPSFLDSHIRKLTGQHIHLIDFGVLGRRYYEWPYAADPGTFKTAPIKRKYTLPKEVFPLYKSSSMHIKRSYMIPTPLIVLVLCLSALLAGGWYLYGSVQTKITPSAVVPAGSAPASGGGVAPSGAVDKGSTGTSAEELLTMFDPRLRGRPETAPAYDALRVVKQMPQIDGCMETKRSCVCFTQQGTNAGLDRGQCHEWMVNRPFNAFAELKQEVERGPKTPARNEPGVSEPATTTPLSAGAGAAVQAVNDSNNPRYNVALR